MKQEFPDLAAPAVSGHAALGTRARAIRLARRLRLVDVAARAGCTKGYLSKIEQGKATPSIATVMRLAGALGVDVAELLAGGAGEDPHATVHVRPEDRLRIVNEGAGPGYAYFALAAARRDKAMEPFLLTVHPDEVVATKTFEHPGEEFIHVLSGTMDYRVGDERFRMQAGDSLYFDATRPHAPHPIGGPVTFIAVFCAPRGRGAEESR